MNTISKLHGYGVSGDSEIREIIEISSCSSGSQSDEDDNDFKGTFEERK
jgi:hypothetical protein